MDGWVDAWMDGWVNGSIDGGIYVQMDGWIYGWMDLWMDGWIDGWMEGRTDRGIDEWEEMTGSLDGLDGLILHKFTDNPLSAHAKNLHTYS